MLKRRWRRAASLALGLPLLIGSPPAAAAIATAAVVAGLTTWIGVLAALWAVLGPRPDDTGPGTAVLAALAAVMVVSVLRGWRQQRSRFGASRDGAATLERAPTVVATRLPSALDADQVLEAARARFLRLQAAWDDADVQAMRHLTTPDMLEQLLPVLSGRGDAPNRTDVITLHAELRGVEEVGEAYLASVEFSGLIRESADAGAVPFREMWLLSSGKDGSPSWRLARQQALF